MRDTPGHWFGRRELRRVGLTEDQARLAIEKLRDAYNAGHEGYDGLTVDRNGHRWVVAYFPDGEPPDYYERLERDCDRMERALREIEEIVDGRGRIGAICEDALDGP
jgi:hypothetical protein